ncbi:hypothetical protein B0H10DRAFT_1787754 [Mycena sp. CBHHK59/15]|nr:hypothetical protein B0H10DRAFT_1802568 [Mycena sp. CBHHK59/15]KAJ6622545.1 hypothetical protein B0H10DRAFT_1787754 [Mycena sp. CBHHK59/15]
MPRKTTWREPNHRLALVRFGDDTAYFQNRGDTCFVSNLPIIAGQYGKTGKKGVYYEVTIREMKGDGTIALGMQCLPYPPHRLPGWHRKSAALHLDDRRIYFDNSEGGSDYMDETVDEKSGKLSKRHCTPHIRPNDTLGCGYEFNNGLGKMFYTYNGQRLATAFNRIFDPQENDADIQSVDGDPKMDVFAAIGVTDGPCQFDVNFGQHKFKWEGGPSDVGYWSVEQWNVKGLFNRLSTDEPPRYGI